MKRILLILLVVLMLWGCSAAPRQEIAAMESIPMSTTEPTVPSPVGFYDPDSTLENISGGALQVYPLYRSDVISIIPMDSGVLVFSGETSTTLTLLAGSDLYVKAVANLNCKIQADDPAVQVSVKGVTYYEAATRELVFLDAELKEGTRVAMPEDMIGSPALSANRKNLYYCTANALRTIELDTGLNILLREMASIEHQIIGLHCADMIIACQTTDSYGVSQTLFVSAENGRTLWETSDSLELATMGSRYFVRHLDGSYPELLTGTINGQVLQLRSEVASTAFPVLALESALLLTDKGQDGTVLELYHLETGKRTHLLECSENIRPTCVMVDSAGTSLLMLCYDETYQCNIICRWILSNSTVADERSYLQERRTAENPDQAALNQYRTTADQMEQRHGVKLLFWTDAISENSVDLTLTPEYQPATIQQWLTETDRMLSIYPSGFLKQLTDADGNPLRICLVRSFEARDPGENLSCLLHLDADADPYIFVTLTDNWQTDFQHQLFHVIETHVLTTSSAFDSWTSLNPKSFRYTRNYDGEITEAVQPHLESGAFINLYATSFPKEDRAMTMLAALEPENEDIFQSKVMQSKLKLLSTGIRKTFGYRKSSEVFLWEQYLK